MFSYRDEDSTYLYYGLRPSGAVEMLSGQPTSNGWEFRGESGTSAERTRIRVKIERLPDGRMRFTEAQARGNEPFPAGEMIHYVAADDAGPTVPSRGR